ncbi:hypothetical protein O1R50_08850 [Glycomyces luteolus]|uniref:Uncharacterized protein n=1 Tax=Glycomyces luteolus TaxID=2670330 RepID=A0A9X3ST05_9ACTN|nr:hypothetical protein [Glycomyces luteolus]MDA1359728.1 hypothetical protein [Glycomyces luteolus]
MVEAASDKVPEIARMDDAQPYDARDEVLTRWGADLYRVIPGSLERPSANLNQLALLARSIDGYLRRDLGFGIGDVGEVVLRRISGVAEALAPHWPNGEMAPARATPSITEPELLAAGTLPVMPDFLEACEDSDRAQLVVERYFLPPAELKFRPSDPLAVFGSAIGVMRRGNALWLPAGNLVESLLAIGANLAEHAAGMGTRADEVFHRNVFGHVARLLEGSGHTILGPISAGSSSPIHSLNVFGERQILALDVATGLTPELVQARLEDGARTLEQIRPGIEVRSPVRSWTIPQDAEIVHLQVSAGPTAGHPIGAGYALATMEDLEWILYSTQENREDFWYFVRDLANPPGIAGVFAWDLIDMWEVWKPSKSFYTGGVTVNSMLFSPHAAAAEWAEAAKSAATERALQRLALPPLREWPNVVIESPRRSVVGDMNQGQCYQILPWSVPVAIARLDPDGPPAEGGTLWDLATGIAWKLTHSADAFQTAASASALGSVRIEFKHQDRASGPALSLESLEGGILTFGWDSRLQMALGESSFGIETMCGELIAQAFEQGQRTSFTRAWEAAPPGIRADGYSLRQQARHLPDPLTSHESLRNDMRRKLAAHLLAEGVSPGSLTGDAAKFFESETVFPWLKQQFHHEIAHLQGEDLAMFAATQLECANRKRSMLDRRLSWRQGFAVRGDDGMSQEREQVARSTRVISFILEEALASPPAGETRVDDFQWSKALATADLCIDSCFRSDALHHQLAKTSLEISNLHELNVLDSEEATDVDMAAYQSARSNAMRPEPVPIATDQHIADSDLEDDQARAILDQLPQFASIDSAMKSSLGFGIDALAGVLNVATQWEATDHTPVARTTPEAFISEATDLAVGATTGEYAAALDWLTLRGSDLSAEPIRHWETERRSNRVTTRPFIEHGDSIWVMPWTAETALKIFTVYLEDGRLPWPNTILPQPLSKALDAYRYERNLALEKDCVTALADLGFIVQGSIKPEKAQYFGIDHLSGEIDALCIDSQRSRIWVIEAKDPYTPYSAYQTRRLINDFLRPKKYVDKLVIKVSDIQRNAVSVAAKLHAPDPGRSWSIHGLMVTRHVEAAAFAVEPKVPFCTVNDLTEMVDQEELPG